MTSVQGTSLLWAGISAQLQRIRKNEKFWGAFLVFLGAMFLLGTFPFYPLWLIPILALACGIVAYKMPAVGVALGFILGFPSVIYQAPALGWFYLLVLTFILFKTFDEWVLIATLEMVALAPFAFGSFPFFGIMAIIGMAFATLEFGSRRALAIALPVVLFILLFSSIWHVQNSAFLPIRFDQYPPNVPGFMITKPAVADMFSIIPSVLGAVSTFISPESLNSIFDSLGIISGNLITLITADSLIFQLFVWALCLYLLGFLSGSKGRHTQLISSLVLLLLIPAYYGVGLLYAVPFELGFAIEISITVILLVVLDLANVLISRESEVERKEKMKAYGKFGMTDISLGADEKSLDDVGGYEDVKEELRDAIVLPIDRKDIAYAYDMKPPTGILLFGPPGTGKTMLMRALAKELRFNFIEVRCSQIISAWIGESEKNVAEIFMNARKNEPCVLFFDEIDSIAKKRGGDQMSRSETNVLTTLLQEMDGGTKSDKRVIVIGATNRPDDLDAAILRPGRLDKIIYMPLPNEVAREAVFKVHLKKLAISKDISLALLAHKTERFSGADIKNIIDEAKKHAAKDAMSQKQVIPIGMNHLLEVISRVKPSTSLSSLETYEQFQKDFERRTGAEKPELDVSEKESALKWANVIGLDDVRQALLESIELPLLHEAEMKELKVQPSKGILLFGPPGTGKTMIAKAAANELKSTFLSLSAADLMKRGYSEAVGVIRETFNRARENAPTIIFVDEIETFAPARGVSATSEILGQFLAEMDGVKSMKGVVVLAATNKPSMMDPAIMRPGRFDKIFYIAPPDPHAREELFKLYLDQFAKDIVLGPLADASHGFSGADIANVCQAIKMEALRARIAGKEYKPTTQQILGIIKTRRPSITIMMTEEYRRFMEDYGERR